ncbi:hypothetical protein ABFX02_03G013100 [Erythranthe guttata]
MISKTLYSTKKTFYYEFLRTKEEEEEEEESCSKSRICMSEPAGDQYCRRQLVEIRDVYPPPALDSDGPWRIKKSINQHEIDSGIIELEWDDVFEHVLRYWKMGLANYIAMGVKVHVIIFDVTQESSPRKYDGQDAYLQHVGKDEFVLACMGLIKDRNLKAGDDISLYWDEKAACFRFRSINVET